METTIKAIGTKYVIVSKLTNEYLTSSLYGTPNWGEFEKLAMRFNSMTEANLCAIRFGILPHINVKSIRA